MIIYQIGLQSSASTWLFNIVRALFECSGKSVEGLSSPTLTGIEERISLPAENYIVNTHVFTNQTLWFIKAARSPVILSYRDPRDSVASLSNRLEFSIEHTTVEVVRSIASILSYLGCHNSFILHYEDRFFENIESIQGLSTFLGLSLDRHVIADVMRRFSANAVKNIVASIPDMPVERRIVDEKERVVGDHYTKFNFRHVGDTLSGKWKKLPLDYKNVLHDTFHEATRENFPNFSLCFTEFIFSPTRGKCYKSVSRLHQGLGVLLLRDCFLPTGNYHIVIEGDFSKFGQGAWVVLTQSGHVILRERIDKSKISSVHKVIKHDDPICLFINASIYPYVINPRRAGSIKMKASRLA
jgi:hypothetical protein